jgi:hypothetical protein
MESSTATSNTLRMEDFFNMDIFLSQVKKRRRIQVAMSLTGRGVIRAHALPDVTAKKTRVG